VNRISHRNRCFTFRKKFIIVQSNDPSRQQAFSVKGRGVRPEGGVPTHADDPGLSIFDGLAKSRSPAVGYVAKPWNR
jgi:hypothetical protein